MPGDIDVWLFETRVGMACPDVWPLYVVQMLALAIKFGYRRLIISGLVVVENVKLGYRGLPGVIATNVLLEYGRLQCVIFFDVIFKYGRAVFPLGWEALPWVIPAPIKNDERRLGIFIIVSTQWMLAVLVIVVIVPISNKAELFEIRICWALYTPITYKMRAASRFIVLWIKSQI